MQYLTLIRHNAGKEKGHKRFERKEETMGLKDYMEKGSTMFHRQFTNTN
jgi:hypothetical protein